MYTTFKDGLIINYLVDTFHACPCVDLTYPPTGLLFISLFMFGISLANIMRPTLDYRPLQRFRGNKPLVDLAYAPYYDTNHTFLFDRNDPNGSFLSLFQNGSWRGSTRSLCRINGLVYQGYIVSTVRLDDDYQGSNSRGVISYKITTANWEVAHRLVHVQSNGQRVIAYVVDACYSEIKIHRISRI